MQCYDSRFICLPRAVPCSVANAASLLHKLYSEVLCLGVVQQTGILSEPDRLPGGLRPRLGVG